MSSQFVIITDNSWFSEDNQMKMHSVGTSYTLSEMKEAMNWHPVL